LGVAVADLQKDLTIVDGGKSIPKGGKGKEIKGGDAGVIRKS